MARILIIDDDQDFREMLRLTLEDAGHEVEEAADGAEGCDRYGQGQHDLVITDIIMPGKEGVETIITLRKMDPGSRIIAISGGGPSRTNYLQHAKKLGAAEFLVKPFRRHQLLDLIGGVLAPGRQ